MNALDPNNTPAKSLAMPDVDPGQVWLGRLANNLNRAVTVVTAVDGGSILVLHHDTGVYRKMGLRTLINSYRLVSSEEFEAVKQAAATAASVDGTDTLKTVAVPRSTAGKRSLRSRSTALPPAETGTVIDAPIAGPAPPAPVDESPRDKPAACDADPATSKPNWQDVRESAGLSQKALANRAGVSRSTVRRFENEMGHEIDDDTRRDLERLYLGLPSTGATARGIGLPLPLSKGAAAKTSVLSVPFRDHTILVAWDGERPLVPVAHVCYRLSVNRHWQVTSLRDRTRYPEGSVVKLRLFVGSQAQSQPTTCLSLAAFAAWLNNLDEDSLASVNNELLGAYRREAVITIAAYLQANFNWTSPGHVGHAAPVVAPSAQASDTTSAQRSPAAAAHFGPDPLPEQTEQVEFRGHTMPGYTSLKDGSKWVVATAACEVLGIDKRPLFAALQKAGKDGAAMPRVQISYKNRKVPKWLASVEFLGQFVDGIRRPPASPAEVCPEPSCPASLIVDAAPVDSETAGQVPDGMMLVKLNGVPVALSGKAGDEGKIIDSDLAAFIGIDGIRQFRQRLRDYENAGDLIGLDWRPFDGRQSTGNGGTRAFKVDMALLTMEQALFMVAKSNSPRANEMTRHIIGVFLEVQRRGMVQTQPQPQLDVAQVVAAAVSQTVRIVVPEILAAVRAESDANNPKAAEDAKAAESERKRKANIAKKGTETKAFNERFDSGIRKTYEPLLVRFIGQCLDPVDLRDPKAQSRCLTPEQIRVAFGEWLRDTRVHKAAILPPENRAVFTMLSILSNGVAIYAKVDGKNEVKLYPWAFKSGAIVDPRQTTIPGVGGK